MFNNILEHLFVFVQRIAQVDGERRDGQSYSSTQLCSALPLVTLQQPQQYGFQVLPLRFAEQRA